MLFKIRKRLQIYILHFYLIFNFFFFFDNIYAIFIYRNSIDLVLRIFSNFFEDAAYFVIQSDIWYLFSIKLILVISFLLIISLNNEISVCKHLSCIGLIEYTELYKWWLLVEHSIFLFLSSLGLQYKISLKCYLRYKTITSQNVSSEVPIKNFLFHRKLMFCCQDIQVFAFLTIPWFTEYVMLRWVLVHETRYIFEYIFWTTTHEVTKLGQLIDISKGNNFQ